MRTTCVIGLIAAAVLGTATGAGAKVGDPLQTFTGGPVPTQLRLSSQGSTPLTGALAGRVLHRFVSDDAAITVDIVVGGAVIEQMIMYVPREERRGVQVSWFLQDAVGSVLGAQKGMLAFRSATLDGGEKYVTFGGYTMRFTPMQGGLLRVLVSR
jgi:hypothetical protein